MPFQRNAMLTQYQFIYVRITAVGMFENENVTFSQGFVYVMTQILMLNYGFREDLGACKSKALPQL